jgi:hypothetical protein
MRRLRYRREQSARALELLPPIVAQHVPPSVRRGATRALGWLRLGVGNEPGLCRLRPGKDFELWPFSDPPCCLGGVDALGRQDRVGASGHCEEVGHAVGRVDLDRIAGGADADTRAAVREGGDRMPGAAVPGQGTPNFSSYHRWTRASLRIWISTSIPAKALEARLIAASSACQLRSNRRSS